MWYGVDLANRTLLIQSHLDNTINPPVCAPGCIQVHIVTVLRPSSASFRDLAFPAAVFVSFPDT